MHTEKLQHCYQETEQKWNPKYVKSTVASPTSPAAQKRKERTGDGLADQGWQPTPAKLDMPQLDDDNATKDNATNDKRHKRRRHGSRAPRIFI